MAANRALVRASFKGLLRAASKLDRLGASVASELPRFSLPAAAVAPASFREVVLTQFHAQKDRAAGVDTNTLLDSALKALVLANQRVAAVSSGADAKPADVLYSVGQVLRHKVYGYRAVIVGWDARCKASGQWVTSTGTAKLPHGTEQPFYRCLVDIRDRSGAQISYVAQDNVDLLVQSDSTDAKQTPLDKMVIHPLLTRHFDEYRVTEGFYVPTARMLQAYPADTPGAVRRMRAVSRTDYSDSDSESESETGSSKAGRASTLV